MPAHNRRKADRLRIDRTVRIPIQLFPVMPFLGHSIDVGLVNISAGGLALVINDREQESTLKKGLAVRVHIRLPGLHIEECRGVITRSYVNAKSQHLVGVRFTRISTVIRKELEHMSKDNAACDERIAGGEANAWCLPTCSFYALCRKPLRLEDASRPIEAPLELSFQRVD